MKKKSTISIAFAVLCSVFLISCSLMLSSEERKLVGKWHESSKINYDEDGMIAYFEGDSEYKEDRTSSSYYKFTFQFNNVEDGYHYLVYATFNMNATGTWKIDGDNLIEKQNEVQLSNVNISSREELTEEYKQVLKNTFEKEILPQMRDEILKKDTAEIVYLSEREYKYKGSDGTVYTMTKVN